MEGEMTWAEKEESPGEDSTKDQPLDFSLMAFFAKFPTCLNG